MDFCYPYVDLQKFYQGIICVHGGRFVTDGQRGYSASVLHAVFAR